MKDGYMRGPSFASETVSPQDHMTLRKEQLLMGSGPNATPFAARVGALRVLRNDHGSRVFAAR